MNTYIHIESTILQCNLQPSNIKLCTTQPSSYIDGFEAVIMSSPGLINRLQRMPTNSKYPKEGLSTKLSKGRL